MGFLMKPNKRRALKVDGKEEDTTPYSKEKWRKIGGKKSKSLQVDDSKPFSGVFVSSRTLSTMASPPPSLSSFSSYESSLSTSQPKSWKSSGAKGHHNNSPLIAHNPDKEDDVIFDPAQRLGMVMARSRHLPDTWYYSSNHILVNQERVPRAIAPLIRMVGLDEIARLHAEEMATSEQVKYMDLNCLKLALQDLNCRRLGVNVQRGVSIKQIHSTMMNVVSNKNNILDRRFTHMGMGTAIDKDGKLYLCQIFRG